MQILQKKGRLIMKWVRRRTPSKWQRSETPSKRQRKWTNERYRHESGDNAVRSVADCLRKEILGADTVARFGPSDFALILRQASVEEALLVGEKVRSHVSSLNLPFVKITISFGIANFPQDGKSPTDLVKKAWLSSIFPDAMVVIGYQRRSRGSASMGRKSWITGATGMARVPRYDKPDGLPWLFFVGAGFVSNNGKFSIQRSPGELAHRPRLSPCALDADQLGQLPGKGRRLWVLRAREC
jgi:hypothetical protein